MASPAAPANLASPLLRAPLEQLTRTCWHGHKSPRTVHQCFVCANGVFLRDNIPVRPSQCYAPFAAWRQGQRILLPWQWLAGRDAQDPAVEQAFFIMPPLNGPGMDNQGVLVVSLGVATAAEPHPIPEPQQVSAAVLD